MAIAVKNLNESETEVAFEHFNFVAERQDSSSAQ